MKCWFLAIILYLSFPSLAQGQNKFGNEYSLIATFFSGNETDLRIALDMCNSILEKDSTEELAWFYKAHILGKQKQYAEAARSFRKLADFNPLSGEYWNNAGWFSVLAKNYDSAILYCNRSIYENQDQYSAYLNKAHAYLKKKSFHEAEYWYSLSSEMITNTQTLQNGPLADFDLLDSLEPSPVYNVLRNLFTSNVSLTSSNTLSNKILDSIQVVGASDDPGKSSKLMALKRQFVMAQGNETVKRRSLLMIYNYDIGREEFYNNNILRSIETYIAAAMKYAIELRDSIFLFNINYYLSRDIIAVKDYKYKAVAPDDALYFAKEALEVANRYNLEYAKLKAYYQIGEAASYLEKYDIAISNYLSALYKHSAGNDRDMKNLLMNRLIICFNQINKPDSLDHYYNLLINDFKEHNDFGYDYRLARKNYVTNIFNRKDYARAAALATSYINEFGKGRENLADLASVFSTAGICNYKMDKKDMALEQLNRSLDVYYEYSDQYQKENPGKIAPFIGEEMHLSFQYLKRIWAEKGNAEQLFDVIERSKENHLYGLLTLKNQLTDPVKLEEAKEKLPSDAAYLCFSNGNDPEVQFSLGISNNLHEIKSHKPSQYGSGLAFIQQYKLAKVLAPQQQLKAVGDNNYVATLFPLIYYFQLKDDLAVSRGLGKKKVGDSTALSSDARIKVSRVLYDYYIKPHEKLLEGKKRLFVSADMQLHYIPFETLMDEQGKYLGEKFIITYMPSYTIAEILSKRTYNSSSKLLAFGNADYSNYHPEKLQGRAYDYAQGRQEWSELEGTASELEMLKKLGLDAEIITRGELSETNLKKLNITKKLGEASLIHFALHGFTNVTIGLEENSLIVTEPDGGKEDGYLQFYEIYNLDMKPRLVCLSACETSFGVANDDGSNVSMTTAFLAAGAGSCIGSNWKVSDEGTSLFMKEFYTLVKEGKGYAEALYITRKKFIDGKMGEKYRAPFYWAPFKYYGF